MDSDNATIRLLLSFYQDETEIVETLENALAKDIAIQYNGPHVKTTSKK